MRHDPETAELNNHRSIGHVIHSSVVEDIAGIARFWQA
jgi:hypothetical protein